MQVGADREDARPPTHIRCIGQGGHAAGYLLRDFLDKISIGVWLEGIGINSRLHRSAANQRQTRAIGPVVDIEYAIDIGHMLLPRLRWTLENHDLVAHIPDGEAQ